MHFLLLSSRLWRVRRANFVWCNYEGRENLEIAKEKKPTKNGDQTIQNEKNPQQEKYIARWRNWQCLVVAGVWWVAIFHWSWACRRASTFYACLVYATKPWHSFILCRFRCLRSIYNSTKKTRYIIRVVLVKESGMWCRNTSENNQINSI